MCMRAFISMSVLIIITPKLCNATWPDVVVTRILTLKNVNLWLITSAFLVYVGAVQFLFNSILGIKRNQAVSAQSGMIYLPFLVDMSRALDCSCLCCLTVHCITFSIDCVLDFRFFFVVLSFFSSLCLRLSITRSLSHSIYIICMELSLVKPENEQEIDPIVSIIDSLCDFLRQI